MDFPEAEKVAVSRENAIKPFNLPLELIIDLSV